LSSLNHIVLIGRLTEDPEIKATNSGGTLAKFTLAVDRPETPNGPGPSDFFPIVCWDSVAEMAKSQCSKGVLTLVEGRIQVRSYETQEQQRRWVTEITARSLRCLEKRRNQTEESAPVSAPVSAPAPASSLEEKQVSGIKDDAFGFNTDAKMPTQFGEEVQEDVPF